MKYLIDVRTKEEYEGGHVDGTLHHDIMEMMEGRFPELPKDAEITLYCESGNRAMMAKMFMEQAGFTQVASGGGLVEMGLL
jgi:phage shock protein E